MITRPKGLRAVAAGFIAVGLLVVGVLVVGYEFEQCRAPARALWSQVRVGDSEAQV